MSEEQTKTKPEEKNISILEEIILESKPDLIDIKKLEIPLPKNSFSSWFHAENPFFVHCKNSENEPISNKINDVTDRKSYSFAQNEETIIYFGGMNEKGELLNTTCGFNKENSKFEELICQGDLPEERCLHTGVFIDKNFVIFGGKGKEDKLLNDIYILSNTLSWTQVKTQSEPPSPRFGHSTSVFENKMIVSGGFDGKNYLTDLYEFNFEKSTWTCLKSEQKIPRAFHSFIFIENRFQILGGRNEHDKEVKNICFFPHKNLIHYESAQEKSVGELLDLKDLKKTFENLKSHWPVEEVNDLKYKMVRGVVEKEFRLFYQTPTEENLYYTTFMRYFQVFMSNFPLFEKTSKEEEPDFAQLFLQFPMIIVKSEQSFRKDFQKDLIDYIAALFNYIMKTPHEESLENIVKKNMTEEGVKSMLMKDDWSQEDKNLLNEVFKVDPLGKVYETIIATEKLKDLPERYQNVMKILTQKIMKWMRMEDDNPENLEKIKWINTLFTIIKPFMGVVNPLALLDKVVHIVLFSRIGRSGISLMLELSKTEKEIASHKDALKKQTKVLFYLDKWLLDKPFDEQLEIIKKWDKPEEKKEKKKEEIKIEIKKEVSNQHKKELPPVPSKKLPELPKKDSTKILPENQGFSRKGSLSTNEMEIQNNKNNLSISPREKELPPVPPKKNEKKVHVIDVELFKPYFLKEIMKSDENIVLKDEEIGHCKEYLLKSIRLTQKKDFLRFIDDPQVQKLIKTSLKVTMVPLMRLYAHTDVGRVAGTLITASQQFVLLLESDSKAKKDLANLKGEKKEEFEKKIHQEWETKFLKIAHTIQNEIYYIIHEIFCKDQKSNNTIGKLTQWVNDMITEVGTKQLHFEEIYYKSSLEERDRIFLEECHYLFFKTKNIPKREIKKEVKKFSSTDFIKGNTNSPKDKFLPPTPTKK